MEIFPETRYLKQYELTYQKTDLPTRVFRSSKDAETVLREIWSRDINIVESFYIVTLNKANIMTGFRKLSSGGLDACIVDVRLAAKYCIECLAPACIIAHNHPSGNAKASSTDMKLTEKIKAAFGLLDVNILDHIILTKDGYLSFADEGLL